jgi:licheninase
VAVVVALAVLAGAPPAAAALPEPALPGAAPMAAAATATTTPTARCVAPPPRPPADPVLGRSGLLAALLGAVAARVRPPSASAPPPAAAPCPRTTRRSAGDATSAGVLRGWGEPSRVDEFDGTALGPPWGVYNGPGHGGNGRRTPRAVGVRDGILTITGDARGNTAGMEWGSGQRYGRWEGRVRAPASDRTYNALLLLWPDAENFPVGGEIDFMEMMDHTRQETNVFLHYGKRNRQVSGSVRVDATQWHNWAVEWTPTHVATFLDGKQWWRTDRTDILPPGPMHLCVQLDWFPDSGRGRVRPSTMQVDWVKQYTLGPADARRSASAGAPPAAADARASDGRALAARVAAEEAAGAAAVSEDPRRRPS